MYVVEMVLWWARVFPVVFSFISVCVCYNALLLLLLKTQKKNPHVTFLF